MAKGWKNESRRHSLASKGIKTAIDKDKVMAKVPNKNLPDWTSELRQFSGTEQYYKGYLGTLRTDGVQFFSAHAGWLITDIESVVKAHPKVKKEEFVSVKVSVKDETAKAVYGDGNENNLYTQRYTYTDLPDGEYYFYYTNNVLMLSNEY